MTKREVGLKMAKLRIDRGISQHDLALELEHAQSNICRTESGEFYPSYSTICKYAEFFGVSPMYFFEE